jgi:hypothetical protein
MWTYYPSSGLPRDALRLMIGDTVPTDQQLQDEELAVFIAQRGTITGAAADACRSLAAKYSRSVTQAGGGSASAAFSDLSKAYSRMAFTFEARSAARGSMPYVGGISMADKQQGVQDADDVQPQFMVGILDNVIPTPATQK